MTKRTPWVRALAYPLAATSVITRPGFVRTDLLRDLSRDPEGGPTQVLLRDRYVGGVHLTTPQLAQDRGTISEERGLHWWDLSDAEEGTQVSGYTVEPCLVVRSNRFTDTLFEVVGETDPLPLEWEVEAQPGLCADCWETWVPDAEPQTEAIAWRGTDRDENYRACTTQKLPAQQSFALRLWWLGTAPVFEDDEDAGPFLDFTWGEGTWAVSFTLFRPPALCRWLNGEWRMVRTFTEFGTDLFAAGVPVWLRVACVAGRLVVELEATGGQGARVVYTETSPDAFGQPQLKPVQVPAGRAALQGRGVAFNAQLHEYLWGRWVPEETDEWGLVTPAHFDGQGSFQRQYRCNRRVNAAALQTAAFGYYGDGNPYRRANMYEGDAGSVAQVTDEPVLDAQNRTIGERRYTCRLRAHNPDLTRAQLEDEEQEFCMAGATTPFVYGASVRLGSSRVSTSLDPVDLRPALKEVTESLADPLLQAGPLWQLKIARNLLPECIHQGTGQPIGHDWDQYVNRNHRLDVEVSWIGADGAVSAGEPPYEGTPASSCRRLIGFLMSEAPDAPGSGQYPGTLTARDFSVLLQAPAGVVDGRFGPLDLLLHEKLADGDRALYGWEGVQYILEAALGPEIAAGLVHQFPEGHYDLLTHRLLLDPPQGGFFYPPPWGQSAAQWIAQLAERDFAVFFWAAKAGEPTAVYPHYVNYYSYLAGAPEVELPDAVYGLGDSETLVTRAGWRHDPAQDFNRVLVWGAPPGQGSLGGVMPALQAFSAEARIEDDSPIPEQNISDTWERTKLLRGSQFWLGRVARVVALNTARLLRGVDWRGIDITIRGNPYLWWGWKVRPRMNAPASDPHGLDLHGQLCRIIRLNNTINLEKGRYETALRVAPEVEI